MHIDNQPLFIGNIDMNQPKLIIYYEERSCNVFLALEEIIIMTRTTIYKL